MKIEKNSRFVETYKIFGKEIKIFPNYIASQASSSLLLTYGKTTVFTTVTFGSRIISDFVPLKVVINDRMYSVNKVPTFINRRELRSSEYAILCARFIDRSIRPLLDPELRDEVELNMTILEYDRGDSIHMVTGLSAVIALNLAGVSVSNYFAVVAMCMSKEGDFIIDPNEKELEKSVANLLSAITEEKKIVTVELNSDHVSEKNLAKIIDYAVNISSPLIEIQREIINKYGGRQDFKDVLLGNKDEFINEEDGEVVKKIESFIRKNLEKVFSDELVKKIFFACNSKVTKVASIRHYRRKVVRETQNYLLDISRHLSGLLSTEIDVMSRIDVMVEGKMWDLIREKIRLQIINEGLRDSHRKLQEMREIEVRANFLSRSHGSAAFSRGETEVISVVTLGSLNDCQYVNDFHQTGEKFFFHHYNFHSFSTGEVTGRFFLSRREIGHGSLAERALMSVVPDKENFPYTIRVVSEVVGSDGSTSQAAITSSSIALMGAGVPIREHIAGLSMGLIYFSADKWVILTDINALEDKVGDMDLKVSRTRAGVCTVQLDLKIRGVSKEIFLEAIAMSQKPIFRILDLMNKEIDKPIRRENINLPVSEIVSIPKKNTGYIIGREGTTIKKIIADSGIYELNVSEGTNFKSNLTISGPSQLSVDKAKKIISDLLLRMR